MKAVLFDLDGVILNSEPIYTEINRKVLDYFHVHYTEDIFNECIGTTNHKTYQIFKDAYNLPYTIEEMVEYHSKIVLDTFTNADYVPSDGIPALLATLKHHHIPTAIASSSPKHIINIILNKLNLIEYFQEIVSGEEVAHGKPAPDTFLEAAKRLTIAPADCVVIEDSKHGSIAAKAAGMTCIGYQNLGSGNQDLSAADVIVNSITEIDILKF